MLNKAVIISLVGLAVFAIVDTLVMIKQYEKSNDSSMIKAHRPEEDSSFTPTQIDELIPEPDPSDLQAHLVYCLAPWGKIIPVFFSADQWQMLNQVAEMSGQDMEELICEIAATRYEMTGGEIFPPDDPFPPF